MKGKSADAREESFCAPRGCREREVSPFDITTWTHVGEIRGEHRAKGSGVRRVEELRKGQALLDVPE